MTFPSSFMQMLNKSGEWLESSSSGEDDSNLNCNCKITVYMCPWLGQHTTDNFSRQLFNQFVVVFDCQEIRWMGADQLLIPSFLHTVHQDKWTSIHAHSLHMSRFWKCNLKVCLPATIEQVHKKASWYFQAALIYNVRKCRILILFLTLKLEFTPVFLSLYLKTSLL